MRLIMLPSMVLLVALGFLTSAKAELSTRIEQTFLKQTAPSETACIAATPAEQRALNAAKNEGRQLAEATNGGLGEYRAEPAMHGSVVDAPCEVVSPGVWRFIIRGGDPIAVSTREDYTFLSVVTVNAAVDTAVGGSRSINLEYNGPIENYAGPPLASSQDLSQASAEEMPAEEAPVASESPMASEEPVPVPLETACIATTPAEQRALNAAKNEARQAAEAENGGIGVYRAEPAMHGSVVDAPCEVIGPNIWRFTFRGGEPVAVSTMEDYTLLSVVTVEGSGSDRIVMLKYNGPIEDYN